MYTSKTRRFWACVVIAPFGRPVVPEVNRMSARSSPVMAAARASASAAGTASPRSRYSSHDDRGVGRFAVEDDDRLEGGKVGAGGPQ